MECLKGVQARILKTLNKLTDGKPVLSLQVITWAAAFLTSCSV